MPTKARIIKEHAPAKPLRKHNYVKCPACGVKLVWPYDERCPECDLAVLFQGRPLFGTGSDETGERERRAMKTGWYPEICCDICCDVVHNHFDCPACGEKYAPTSIYSEAFAGEEFSCKSCGARFKYIEHGEVEPLAPKGAGE